MDDSSKQGPVVGAVVRQGLPLALGMASHVLFNLVDLLMVGRLGEDAVAGVHVATTINFLPMIVGNGVSAATMSMMARQLGSGRTAAAAELSSRALGLMLVAGLVLGGIGALLAVPCVALQGVRGAAYDIGVHYLVVSHLGTVTMFALMQATATMRARGEAAMPFALLIGANVVNLALDVVLIFGWDGLGIPGAGAPGAAYATVLARLGAAAVGVWWIARPRYPLRLRRGAWRGPPGELFEVLRVGLPQGLQMTARAVVVVALTRAAADVGGQDAVVALGVTTRLDTMVLFAAVGFASAATTQVGLSLGAGQELRARAASRTAGLGAMVLGGALVAVFVATARPLIGLFVEGAGEGVVQAGVLYLSTAALGHPLAAYCIAVTGGVNGAGRVLAPVVIDLVGYLAVLLPAVALTATQTAAGDLAPVWWAFAAANLLIASGYAAYVERGRWCQAPTLPSWQDPRRRS